MPAHLIAQEGPTPGLVLNFSEGNEWIVGRDPAADFVIDNNRIARKHARITKEDEGLFIESLNRRATILVNEHAIDGRTRLNEGDRVQIGDLVFLYSLGDIPEGSVEAQRGKKEKKPKGGYEDIFSELETPELPPEPEPVAGSVEETAPEPAPPALPEEQQAPHDTIFEDAGAEPQMPFNLFAETPLILKVIGGPNAGAEIGLEKGRSYLIGKDPNTCDIVFQDLSVSRHHARLIVTPEGILELEDLGSKNGTAVNNTPITEKRTITTQDSIAMGTTICMVVDREALQETIYAPKAPAYEEPKIAPAAAAEAPQPLEEQDWKTRKIPSKHLIAAGSFVLVLFVMFLSFFSLFKAKPLEVVAKGPEKQIEQALVKFGGVQYSFNPASGKLFLAGHVLTPVDYQEMRYNVDQIAMVSSVEDNVIIDEYVWKMMSDVLAGNAGWRGVIISSPEAGRFVAHGYVQTIDQLAQLTEYLNVNFPYPDRLQNKAIVEDTLNAQIQGLLQTNGFGAVGFQLSAGDLMLVGRYSDEHESEYRKLVDELGKLEGVQSVKNFAVAALPSQASIDLTQQYKVSGSSRVDGRGYSAVINGRVFMLGDLLDGMKISTIEPRSILLEKDGLKYRIDYIR